jgi:hypothetical protein
MATSHEIAQALLRMPDIDLVDEYAENVITGVKEGSYDAGKGNVPCVMYETEEYDP